MQRGQGMAEMGKSFLAEKRLMASDEEPGGRAIVKVSPAYPSGNICAVAMVNLLPKITSALSRVLCNGADTQD